MRWLKTLVIGMGVVIVIGLTVVIVKVAQRAGEPSQPVGSGPAVPAPPVIGATSPMTKAAPTGFAAGNHTIAIPAGATAEDMTLERDRLVVRLRLSDGRAAFLTIDLATGKKLGMITLENRSQRP